MNIEKAPNSSKTLPLKQSLKGDYVLLFVIGFLVAVASISGLLASGTLYPVQELRNGFVITDILNLLLVLPLLLWGYLLYRRRSLVGLIFCIGSLFVIMYHYIAYASAYPMTSQFVLYIVLVGFSTWAIIRLIRRIDLPEIKKLLAGAVPVRLTAGVLIILGLLFFLRAGDTIIKAFSAGKILPPTECADLFSSILWFVGGIVLWQKKAVGYVIGAGLILQASILFVGLLIYFILQPVVANISFPLEDFIVIFFMGWLCYIPFGLYIRGIMRQTKRNI